jgi:hypothetical protein
MSKRLAAVIAAPLAAVLMAACGSKPRPKPVKLPPSVVHACPQALNDKGAMGECTPPQVEKEAGAR